MSALVAFIHHLAAFTLVAALAIEKLQLRDAARDGFSAAIARKLARTDMIFGIAATVVLVAGLARVFHFEKGAGYYFHSIPFILKATLFVVVGIASIIPTVEFIRWGKALKAGQTAAVAPERIAKLQKIVQFELFGVIGILLCAALMAKGIGVFG